MADDAIDTSKIPELGDDFFARASVRRPVDSLAVELDPEVDAWLKAHGHEHRTEINERLRELMDSLGESP